MIDIGSRTGHKLGILIVLTTLAIGSVAGLDWENPRSNEDYISGNEDLNVTFDNEISDVEFFYDEGDGWISIDTATSQDADGNFYWTAPFDDNNIGSVEDIQLKANGTDGNSNTVSTNTLTLTRDSGGPDSFSLDSPSDFSSTEDPTVEVSVSDQYSGVDNISMTVEDQNNDEEGSAECDSNNCEIELDNLEEGETYDVEIFAYDRVGNSNSDTLSFTVDTEYDGDSNPSFSVEDESDGVVVFDDDKDLIVDFGDADSTSDTTVDCIVEGEDVDSFTVETGDGDEEYTCEIPEDDDEDYYDSSAEIYLEMEDEAGNTAESDSETVSFDVNPPTVTGLEITSQAELYNTNFDVEFTAYDSASDVEEVEYYFDSDTSEGDGNNLDYDSDTDTYEIDTSDLGEGDQTLYIRAMDEADRWSSSKSVDFRFDPDAVPEISLAVPDSISVIAGSESSFDVTVENTGELHISSIELTGSAEGVFSDSQSISDLEAGESVTVSLDVNTESNNLGEHTVEVSTDNPSMSENLDMVVEANSDQQTQIDSDLSSYQEMLQEMESNVTDLRNKVSESKAQRLDSNFSTFKEKVQNAQSAVDNGDYYQAESILEGIDQDYSAAESSYETVKEEYENNQFWMLLVLGVGGFFVLSGGAIGAASYSDEVEFDVRDYLEKLKEMDFDLDLNTSALDGLTEKLSGVAEGKDTSSAENFEWEGFKEE